jgi:hypothetical protein|tara:strand:- start:61 stop:291 length:231 start_codon:yes stop_codon:yes gene_type:complete
VSEDKFVGKNTKQEVVYNGMIDTFQKIYRNEGISGFYKGITPSVIKIFPTSGLFFLTYELTLGYLSTSSTSEIHRG